MIIKPENLIIKVRKLRKDDIYKESEKKILEKDFFICSDFFNKFQDKDGVHYAFQVGFDFDIHLKEG